MALSIWSMRTTSLTVDETYFLSCALRSIQNRQLDPVIVNLGCPPLQIILDYSPLLCVQRPERTSLWTGHMEDPQLIKGPRFFNLLLTGVPLVLVVSFWLYRRRGFAAGAAGAGLIALSPSILAHSALATTDAGFALFVMLALAGIAAYLKAPSKKRFFLMALSIAAAMSTKYAALFLLPVALCLLLLREFPTRPKLLLGTCIRFSLLVLLVLPLWWGLHLFSSVIPQNTVTQEEGPGSTPVTAALGHGPVARWFADLATREIKIPAPLVGTASVYMQNQDGRETFLNGEYSHSGWWYYYPYAFFFKSTPAELAVAVVLIISLIAALLSPLRSFRSLDIEQQVLVVSTILFLASFLNAHIMNHRYILPLYPLLVVLGIDRIWNRLGDRHSAITLVAILLVGCQLWSCLSIAPHYLSYFNGFVGGPQNGWRLLVDQNIDWGQDLPALQHELEKWPKARVALSYFGTALPKAYGVQADPVKSLSLPAVDYNIFAVSVTHLQGLYGAGNQPFGKFLSLKPASRAGYSIFLYDLSNPAAKAAFQSAVEIIHRAEDHPADGAQPLSLFDFTLTLMAAHDFSELDVFDLCYSKIFHDPAAAPSQLAFIEEKLKQSAGPTDYRSRFRLAILHITRWLLLPRVSLYRNGSHWSETFDFDAFREEYRVSRELLKGSSEIAVPLNEVLDKTENRIDENHDGSLSNDEITAFLAKK